MTEKGKTSWRASIVEAAKEQGIPLPPFTGGEMGGARTERTATGRFGTIKRRFVSEADAADDGIEFTLWRTLDDVPLPVVGFRAPLRPNQEQVANVFGILKRWLVDEASLDDARSAVASRAHFHDQESAPTNPETREYWLSDDPAFGFVVGNDRWAVVSRGKSLTSWSAKEGRGGGDHWPLDSLDRLCFWVADHWPVVAFGNDCRPDPLRGYGARACRAYEVAELARGAREDGEIRTWWSRHAFRAGDPDLPNIFFERQADKLVASWDASPTPSRFYNAPDGEEALPPPIAVPALRRLVIDRLNSMNNLGDADRRRALEAVSSDAAAGYRALARYKSGVGVEWLAAHGFNRKDAEDVALTGASRHPIVGLLRTSRGGSISIDDYDSILNMLKPSDLNSFRRLRELAKGLNSPIDMREPWESGYRLAGLVLERLGGSPSKYIDIEKHVRDLGVEIHEVDLPDADILGVCVGTPGYKPSILVNVRCDEAKGVSGRRLTLAHELCHLLFDRAGLRSLARFEGGTAADGDRLIEMRANAFAIELLVPMAVLIDQTGEVLAEDRLREVSREQEVSLVAIQRHAGNLRNRLSKR